MTETKLDRYGVKSIKEESIVIQKRCCTCLWDADTFGAGAAVWGRQGAVGTRGRVAGDPRGAARQNCDSAQGFHRVCAAQQSRGCRDRRGLRLCGIRGSGLTAGPRRENRQETDLMFNHNLGTSWLGPPARCAQPGHPHSGMETGDVPVTSGVSVLPWPPGRAWSVSLVLSPGPAAEHEAGSFFIADRPFIFIAAY